MKRILLLAICAFLAFRDYNVSAQTTAPKLLPFQGRLTDQNGVAVSNGVRLVQFKIYDVPTGGSPVWAGELHRTTVNGGLVNVMLGSKTPLSGVDFDKQLYLEITVDVSGVTGQPDNSITAADPPMLPRQAILPVVFAKEAADSRLLDGYDWAAIFGTNNPASGTLLDSKIRDGSVNATKILAGSITSAQIGPATITGGNIAESTISSNNIAPGTIDYSILAQRVIEALNPAGAIIAFGGSPGQIPSGWLLCDGTAVSSGQYQRLYSAISTNWGAGVPASTNNFSLPDLRGIFLRGVNGSRSGPFSDPDFASRTTTATGGNTGNNVGSGQPDQFESHSHTVWRVIGSGQTGGSDRYLDSSLPTSGRDSNASGLVNNTGGSETRPVNAYVHYIIKY